MNRIYRLVYNTALGLVQVAPEHGTPVRRKNHHRNRHRLPPLVGALTSALLLSIASHAGAQALPQNGTITSGSGIINVNGNTMTVTQQSQAALFQWSSFSIGSGNTVRFDQADSRSTAINLVTGPSASIISGQLLSNGQVFLLNPAGITFTGTASVNVGGLLASTLMPGAQGIPLDGGALPPSFELGGTGTNAAVSNLGGTLTATAGGISLVGGSVFNNGYIAAPLGNIGLAAAGAVTAVTGVSSAGMPSLAFVTTAASGMAGTGISNVGTLSARNISMTALMGPGLSSTGINAGGTIIANAIDGADGSLTIRSSAPVAINNAIITANAMSTVGSAVMGGPVAIQMTGGSIDATTVNLNGGTNGDVVLSGSIKSDSIGINANNITQTAGSLEGALQLDTQGRVTLGQASNAINRLGGHVGTDLTLATSTGLANSGALSVGGNTTLDAATGNITLTHAGNSFGNRVSANGADVSLAGIGALNLGNIDARSLIAQGGSLGLSGTITTSGDQAYLSAVTLQGNSTLQGGTIRFDGTVDGSYYLGVTASELATFEGALGGSTALQGLNVATGNGARLSGDVTTLGMLAFTGPLQVYGSRRLTSLGGNMTLGGAVDGDGGDLSLSARQLTLGGAVGATGAVDRLYATADTIALGSRIASRREMLLQGDIRLDGNTQLISTNDGVITTDGISSNIGSGYNLTISTGNQIQVNGNISAADVGISGQLFSGRGIVSKGNLAIDSRLNLLQTGSYQVDGLSRFSSQGDITLTDAGNRFSGEVTLLGGNAELRAGDLLLGSTSLQGSLGLHLAGGLQQASGSVLNIGGTTRIDAGGPINLDRANGLGQPVNRFGGEVSLKGRGSYISAAGTLAFSDFDVDSLVATADVIQLPASGRSIGLQYFQGNVVLTRDSVLDSLLGQINFRGRIDGGHALTIARGLNVVFADDVGSNQALASLDISGAGPLNLGGNITADGAIRLGNVNLVSNIPRLFSIRSNNGNLLAGRIDGSSDGRSSLALNAHGALELQSGAGTTPGAGLTNLELTGSSVIAQAIRTSGRLDVTSTTGFTQGGTLTVGGDASFSAGSSGNLVLDAMANSFAGKVALSGNQVRIRAQPNLVLDGVIAATLDAGSASGLSMENTIVSADATVSGQQLHFGDSRIHGNLTATSTGNIEQSAPLRVAGSSQLQANGDIQLGQAGNHFGGRVDINAASASISSADSMQLGNVTTTGNLQVGADAGLRLDGQIRAANVDLATAGVFDNRFGSSAIALTGPGRWQVYLASPFQNHVFGGLDSGNTAVWNTTAFTHATGSDNRYLFAWQPTLTVTANTLRKIYGDSIDPSNAFSITGAMSGVTGAYLADSVADLITGNPLLASTGASATVGVMATPYAVDVSAGTLDTGTSGYALSFVQGELWVDPKALTITANNGGKTYGQTGGLAGFSSNGLVNGDTVSSVDLGSTGTAATANVGDYTITAGNADGTGLSNYDITYVDGTLSIGKAGLTITANNGGKTYGQTGGLAGFTSSGLVNGDSVSSVDLGSTGSAATATVGDYTIAASNADGTGLSNYDITYVDGTLSIGKAGLTITANNGGKTYGQTGGLAGFSSTGLLNGDSVSSVDLGSTGTAATANVGEYTITASNADGTGLSNYDITYVDGTLSIGKAGLTITANNGGKTYGQTGGFNGFTSNGLVNGDSVSSVDLGSTGSAGTATVGDYTIAASNADGTGLSNYDITYVDGTLKIGKAGLTITANNGGKTYGQTGGLAGFSSNGLVNGDSVSSVDLGSNGSAATANVGDYTISASNADGTGLSNYDITYVDGTLSIGKAGLTITANNGGKTYGQTGGLAGFTSSGLVNGDSVSSVDLGSTGSAATATVGDYTIAASNADGTGLSNYDITYVDGTLSIGKAGLTITANNGGKTYGQTGGLAGFTSSGLVNGDSVSSVDLGSTGSAATANVGNYTITASNSDGTGLSNYDITYVDGTLKIGKAGLTITANNGGKTYGQTGGLAGFTSSGLVNGDSVSSVDLGSTGSAATANVGDYTITAGNADGTGLSNYDITYVDGTLSIGKAGLTITATDTWKWIGQSLPLHGYTVNGLKNGDTIDSVRLVSAGSDASARPGRYDIFASDAVGARLGNYDIHYQGGQLEVAGTSAQAAAQAAQLVAASLPRGPAPLPDVATPLISISEGGLRQPASCTDAERGSCLGMPPE